MKLTRFPVQPWAVPVKHSIRCVTVLLSLKNDCSGPDCMQAAAGNKNSITRPGRKTMREPFNIARMQGIFKILPACPPPKTGEDFCPRLSVQKIPALSFGLPPKTRRNRRWRMNLQ